MAPFMRSVEGRSYELSPDELEAVIAFLCVGLPRLSGDQDERTGRVLDALHVLVQRVVNHPNLHKAAASPSVYVKIRELLQAVASAPKVGAKENSSHAASGDLEPSTGHQAGSESPPGMLSQLAKSPSTDQQDGSESPPRMLSQLAGAERVARRSQLPAPLLARSLPFEVIQANFEHQKARLSAQASPPSPLSPQPYAPWAARGDESGYEDTMRLWREDGGAPNARSPPRRTGSAAPLTAEERRLRSQQQWSASTHNARIPSLGTAGGESEAASMTLVESCESYLDVLRAQQDRLKEQRRLYEEDEVPPVPGWYSLHSKQFNPQLRRAWRWTEPSALDWWREGSQPVADPLERFRPAVK